MPSLVLVATKFFRGVKGIHPKQGLTASDVVQVRTDRKMIDTVQDLIILADHTKFNSMGSIQVGPISIASVIITDVDAPKDDLELIRQMGCECYHRIEIFFGFYFHECFYCRDLIIH